MPNAIVTSPVSGIVTETGTTDITPTSTETPAKLIKFADQILTAKAKTSSDWYTLEQVQVLVPQQLKPIIKTWPTRQEKTAEDTKRVRFKLTFYKRRNFNSILHHKLINFIYRTSYNK